MSVARRHSQECPRFREVTFGVFSFQIAKLPPNHKTTLELLDDNASRIHLKTTCMQ